jgi:hypothetical protein
MYVSCRGVQFVFVITEQNLSGFNRTEHLVARISPPGGTNARGGLGDHPIPAWIGSTRGTYPQQPNEA